MRRRNVDLDKPEPGRDYPRELDSFHRGGGDDLWAVRLSNGAACAGHRVSAEGSFH